MVYETEIITETMIFETWIITLNNCLWNINNYVKQYFFH